MATNLQIDNQLLSEAQRLGNFKTKRETVDRALKAFIEQRKQSEMLDLEGEIDYVDDYDYKRQRKAR